MQKLVDSEVECLPSAGKYPSFIKLGVLQSNPVTNTISTIKWEHPGSFNFTCLAHNKTVWKSPDMLQRHQSVVLLCH